MGGPKYALLVCVACTTAFKLARTGRRLKEIAHQGRPPPPTEDIRADIDYKIN